MGIEAEMIVTGPGGGSPNLSKDVILAANSGELASGVRKVGVVDSPTTRQINGAKVYGDVNNLVEGATPESLGPRQLANAFVAMRTNLIETVAAMQGIEGGKYEQIQLLARTALLHYVDEQTFGMHLNMTTPLAERLDTRIKDTRFFTSGMGATLIWSGVGCLNKTGFQLSQKISGLADKDGDIMPTRSWGHRTSNNDKPAITWSSIKMPQPGPMESYGNLYDRAEWRLFDIPHSQWQLFMAAAVGSHTMRLIEQKQHLPPDFFARNTFRRIAQSLSWIGRDVSLSTNFSTLAGTRVTALDINEMHTEALLDMHTNEKVQLPADEVDALHERVRLNDDLRRSREERDTLGYKPLADRLERVARYLFIARKVGEGALYTRNQRALDLDLRWDREYPEGIASKYWSKAQKELYDQNQADIEYLRYNPPPNTRAAAFMHVLEHFKGQTIEDYSWHYIQPIKSNNSTLIYFPDPYDAAPPKHARQIKVAMPRRPHSSEMFDTAPVELARVYQLRSGPNEET